MNLLKNIRFYVLLFSLFFSLGVYIFITQTIPEGNLQIIRLTQIYALTALSFLYLAVIAGPLIYIFPWLPFRGQYMKARRAIGFSTFYFGLIHACFAFFGQLGGFGGLPFLSGKYLLAISLSFTSLVILSLMASTSFDFMVAKLTFRRWKFLHRFVYLVVLLITIHALMLGTHFTDLSGLIPQIFSVLLAILLLLEANRFDAFLERKFQPEEIKQPRIYPRFGITTILALVLVSDYFFTQVFTTQLLTPLGIHSQHQTAFQPVVSQNSSLNPALQGNSTIRYNVLFTHPETIQPKTPTELNFAVTFASNGAPEMLFNFLYTKQMHLIVVSDDLKYFAHLHPEQSGENFKITAQFPNPGPYHIYINYQPVGAIEQQIAFAFNVNGPQTRDENLDLDQSLQKDFDGVTVKLEPDNLSALGLNRGTQKIKFTLTNRTSGEKITNLKPYLAAFGHLVLVDMETFEFLHIHPTNLRPPGEDENGGPEVEFIPMALYSQINPGIYKAYGEFNVNGKMIVADFIIRIEN